MTAISHEGNTSSLLLFINITSKRLKNADVWGLVISREKVMVGD